MGTAKVNRLRDWAEHGARKVARAGTNRGSMTKWSAGSKVKGCDLISEKAQEHYLETRRMRLHIYGGTRRGLDGAKSATAPGTAGPHPWINQQLRHSAGHAGGTIERAPSEEQLIRDEFEVFAASKCSVLGETE